MTDSGNKKKTSVTLLIRNNYNAWALQTMVVARKQQLEDMAIGNDDEPLTRRNSKSWKAWRDCRNATAELIISRLDDMQLVHIWGLEGDPTEMWVWLATVHGEGPGIGSSIDLWKKLYNAMYTNDSVPMSTHLSSICAIAEKLEHIHSDKPSDNQIIACMLLSLLVSYSGLQTILNTTKALLTVNGVEHSVLKHKKSILRDRKMGPVSSSSVWSGMVLMTKNGSYKDGIGLETCDDCGRIGHIHLNCFCLGGRKVGQWPDW